MASFSYFLPGKSNTMTISLETLAINDLGGVFDSESFSKRDVDPGPDNGMGILVSYNNHLAYRKETQSWQKIHGVNAWIGFDKANPPKASDLQRDSWIGGYRVPLGNGEEWIAPTARLASGLPNLPCSSHFTKGEWTRGGVRPKHQQLWKMAESFWSQVEPELENVETDQDTIKLSFSQESEYAVTALSANYRIGNTEASLLGLINDDSTSGILNALVDMPVVAKKKLEELQQKDLSDDPGKQD